MPMMVMNHRLSPVWVPTTLGMSFLFRPGEPVNVHESCVEICQAAGAAFVNPDEEKVRPGNVDEPKTELTAAQKSSALADLFADMIADQVKHRDHFTAAGRPNLRWVQGVLKQEFSLKQIEDAWAAAKAAATG